MKECFKCHRTLPLSEFYKHPMMGDGYLGKCRLCTKKDVRANYAARREQYRDYDRARYKMPGRREAIEKSTNKDPLKVWVRKATHSALNWGLLVRRPCEVCGDEKSDAHHPDYTKPLEVRWLCRLHHMHAHHPLEQTG
jgi:hypothetical protein